MTQQREERGTNTNRSDVFCPNIIAAVHHRLCFSSARSDRPYFLLLFKIRFSSKLKNIQVEKRPHYAIGIA